jgi:hypothetical protein
MADRGVDVLIMVHERRVKSRYPLELKVRYQILGSTGSIGVGQTVNISSSGMLLKSGGKLPEGTRLKIFVEWPSLLNGSIPLQLIMVGTVVRSAPIGSSIVFESYQFKTMSRARNSNVTQIPEPISSGYREPQPESIALMAKSSS